VHFLDLVAESLGVFLFIGEDNFLALNVLVNVLDENVAVLLVHLHFEQLDSLQLERLPLQLVGL
jgi:hypothetical protein